MADGVLDAVVVGAGVAGLHMLHRLREQGLRVRAYDAGGDVGGAWWSHGHPGARLDVEGHVYQYLFSERLYADWGWSERFPGGYEVQRWLRFVAERLDLRRDVVLSTRVESAHWDDDRALWTVRTDAGGTVGTRFLLACTGVLPAPDPVAADRFAGPVLRTSDWPEYAHDVSGARVGVVGAGVAAVQLVPAIAGRAAHLTVFAGTVPHVLPMSNPHYGWQERDRYRAGLAGLRSEIARTPDGLPRERRTDPEELYADGSLALVTTSAAAAGFVREKMSARLGDPRLAEVLVPADHELGTRRVALDNGYLETFHRPDADAVATPIARVLPDGVELADGTVHPLDVLVLAVDVGGGDPALDRIDVRGRDGRVLAGRVGPGFPNLFTTVAPADPHANAGVALAAQVEWMAAAIRDLRAAGCTTIEPTADGVLVPGRDLADLRRRHEAEAAAGYPSFVRR